ncbi:MAG TPA: hypothetical protein EYP53_07065 [Candidatus Latescibacteria bacterium]|nr:hypothetical protein [Candidatus Latescibacterota bacterium]
MSRYREISLDNVKTYPVSERRNRVRVEDFASPFEPGENFREFMEALPRILVAQKFRRLVEKILGAVKLGRGVVVMAGAHVVKCGLGPILVDLMERGVISHIALNGGGSIHDFEIALWGQTSEDVAEGLKDGSFGMARETGRLINETICNAVQDGLGYGEALGRRLEELKAPNDRASLLTSGYRLNIPVTVHAALGADIIHQHPSASGSAIGEASHRDFRIFASSVSKIGDGGVVLNIGSAVILPEVFLKALTVVRNLGYSVKDFTSANFDMVVHYRPRVNVLERPTQLGGEGIQVVGHHEIMIPLLAAAIKLGLS